MARTVWMIERVPDDRNLFKPAPPFRRDGPPYWRLMQVERLPHGNMVLCGWQECDEEYEPKYQDLANILYFVYLWMKQRFPDAMPPAEYDSSLALIAGIVVGLKEGKNEDLPPHLRTQWEQDEPGHWVHPAKEPRWSKAGEQIDV